MDQLTLTIEKRIYPVVSLPGRPKALLDRTLSKIYDIETRRLNEAVKNNLERFPKDFYYELTLEETRVLSEDKSFDFRWKGGHLPNAFTYLGCNMLATVIKSEMAVRRAVDIIRGFTTLESVALSSSVDLFQMISAQSRMISALAEEMYRNRRHLEEHDRHIKSFARQMTFFDLRLSNHENPRELPPVNPISSNQIYILKTLVKQKGKTREKIMRIWSHFKRKFDITRYVHLPADKFDEALEWIENLGM